MHLSRLILPIWIPFGLCSALQSRALKNSEDVIKQSIMRLPKCCMNCVLPILNQLHCGDSGNMMNLVNCFCSDMKIQKNVSQCTGTSCNFYDLRESEQLLQVICAGTPRPTQQPQLYTTTIISSILVTVFVALRCHSNYQISKKVWWDDGFLFISTTVFLAFQSLTLWGTSYGFGLHIWTANTTHWSGLYLFEWLWEILYIIVQTMTKVSVLLLYYRIFPQLWFRRVLFVLVGFMFIHFIVFTAVIVTSCKPIQSFWVKSIPGKCLDTRPVGLIGAGCSIAEDVVFLLLPTPLIWRLKLKTSRKVGIILILTIGVIACAASVVRLRYLAQYNQTYDQIWENYLIVVLSQLELSLSIICVCFPAIRLLFSRSAKNNSDSNSKTMSAPSHSIGSFRKQPMGLLSKIFSTISNHTTYGSLSLPWVSSRAPQLSSIYITSHIEFSDKDPSASDANIKGYETHIAATKNPAVINTLPTQPSLLSPSGIMHVDRSGNITKPLRKFTDSIFRGESTSTQANTSQKKEVQKPGEEQIGTAK